MKSSALEKQARLREIAETYADTTIRAMKKTELVVLCDRLIPNLARTRKDELAEKLIEMLAEFRKQLEIEAKERELAEREKELEAVEVASIAERRIAARSEYQMEWDSREPDTAQRIFKKLVEAVTDLKEISQMQEAMNDVLASHLVAEAQMYTPSTRKSRKSRICGFLDDLAESYQGLSAEAIKQAVGYFKRRYHNALSSEVKAVNSQYKSSVAQRLKEQIEVDGKGLLEWAKQQLTVLESWQNVSIALILTTGRRMSEIHATGEFEIVDSQNLMFTGQLKTKGRGDIGSYTIPCLVDSELILEGLNYLKKCEKRVANWDKDTVSAVVNHGYSMPLSRAVKPLNELGLKNYKSGRDIYAEIAWLTRPHPNQAKASYYAQILGHGEHDVTTAQSYEKIGTVHL